MTDDKAKELAHKIAVWPKTFHEAIGLARNLDFIKIVSQVDDAFIRLNNVSMEQWQSAKMSLASEAAEEEGSAALRSRISVLEDQCRALRGEVYRLIGASATPQPASDNSLPFALSWDDAPEWANALIKGDNPGYLVWASSFESEKKNIRGQHALSRESWIVDTVGHHAWQLVATRAQKHAPYLDIQAEAQQCGFDLARRAANTLVNISHCQSVKAGWWTHLETGLDLIQVINEPADALQKLLASTLVAQKLCLSHSELSEAMEGHRKGLMDDKLPHRTMLEVELADAVIRIADLAGALNLDLGGAIDEKLAFNATRPDHQPENRKAAGGKAY